MCYGGFGSGGSFDGLIGFGFRRVGEPEITIVPEYDAESEEEQAERSNHQTPLFGVFFRIFGRAPSSLRQEGVIGFRCDGVQL